MRHCHGCGQALAPWRDCSRLRDSGTDERTHLAQAKDGVRNLGGGLDQLAAPAAAAQALSRQSLAAATAEESLTIARRLCSSMTQAARWCASRSTAKCRQHQFCRALGQTTGVDVIASDLTYRNGVVEAYVPTDALRSLAPSKGVLVHRARGTVR